MKVLIYILVIAMLWSLGSIMFFMPEKIPYEIYSLIGFLILLSCFYMIKIYRDYLEDTINPNNK